MQVEQFLRVFSHFRKSSSNSLEGCIVALTDTNKPYTVPITISIAGPKPTVSLKDTTQTPVSTLYLDTWGPTSTLTGLYDSLREKFSHRGGSVGGSTFATATLPTTASSTAPLPYSPTSPTTSTTTAASVQSTTSGGGDDDDVNVCVVCLTNKRSHVFIPCGHMCCCATCVQQITNCCMCRAAIVNKVRVFQ
eukprot:PhF_6_TR14631/c0_g1_i1/m.23117